MEHQESFNNVADIMFGSICFSCFVIGTFGNITSFLYFKSKKRDMSTVLYMMITGNDILVSIAVLPVAISYWSQRQPGLIFGDEYGCLVMANIWHSAVAISFFLVICLSVTRTVSLIRPFKKLKIRCLLIAVIVYTVFSSGHLIWGQITGAVQMAFSTTKSKCTISLNLNKTEPVLGYFMSIIKCITFIAPFFVVSISCIVTAALLTRRNKNVQQRELQQSRNRATVTILLFALLYVLCNMPIVVHIFISTHGIMIGNLNWIDGFYQFDRGYYWQSTESTQLIVANSAANPLLYIWRMYPMRRSVVKRLTEIFDVVRSSMLGLKRIFRQFREDMRRIFVSVRVVREERQEMTVETTNL